MKNTKIMLMSFILVVANSCAMQEWIRTNLENLGLTQPKLTPTEELKQIINREGTFKNWDINKIKELIALQADVNVVGRGGSTPLFVAVYDNNVDLVMLFAQLVNREGQDNINKQYGIQGLTPLAVAAHDGKPALIPILIKYGASIHTRDNQGNTPLILATRIADQQKAVDVAQKLITAGIDINAHNTIGETALHRAVRSEKYDLIAFLMSQGADRTLLNNQGQTPLALAQAANDQRAIGLLSAKTEKLK